MGHHVELVDPDHHLDAKDLHDFIDLFFGGRDSRFRIEVVPLGGQVPNESIRGQCATNQQGHFRITLFTPNVMRQLNWETPPAFGGNTTKAYNLRHALYLTLTHELRHAYQSVYHGVSHQKSLHAGRYKGRASEVDARRHVDESYEAVCDFLEIPGLTSNVQFVGELEVVVDMLAESAGQDGSVSVDDESLWDHAWELPGDPDLNYRRIRERMATRGLRLSCPAG